MTDWFQQHLTPPNVVECNIRIGIVPESDHVQALVELKDPLTGIQIGSWSLHHRPLAQFAEVADWALAKAVQAIGDTVPPF